MQKKETKPGVQMLESGREKGEEIVGRQSLTCYGIDGAYDDQSSSSSFSDTASDQDSWTLSANGPAKRSRTDAQVRDAEESSANYFHTSGRQASSANHKSAVDEERRKVRRERNKQAAARCRQRRVDLTNSLIAETETLENEKIKLEKEIENLYRQTHELQFVLESHSKRCQMMPKAARANFSESLVPVDLTAIKAEKTDTNSDPESKVTRFGMCRPTSLPIGSSIGTPASMDTPFGELAGGIPGSLTPSFFMDSHSHPAPIAGLSSDAEDALSAASLPLNQTLINL